MGMETMGKPFNWNGQHENYGSADRVNAQMEERRFLREIDDLADDAAGLADKLRELEEQSKLHPSDRDAARRLNVLIRTFKDRLDRSAPSETPVATTPETPEGDTLH